jgi:hypothetical protein
LDSGLAVATQESTLLALAQLGGSHAATGTSGLTGAGFATAEGRTHIGGGIVSVQEAPALAIVLGLYLGREGCRIDATDNLAPGLTLACYLGCWGVYRGGFANGGFNEG